MLIHKDYNLYMNSELLYHLTYNFTGYSSSLNKNMFCLSSLL